MREQKKLVIANHRCELNPTNCHRPLISGPVLLCYDTITLVSLELINICQISAPRPDGDTLFESG